MYKYYLGLKYLLSRRINFLGMAGVMVGVWALILVISIFSGFIREVRAHIRGAASDMSFLAFMGASYQEVERVLLDDPNVAACAPRLVHYGMLHATDSPSVTFRQPEVLDADLRRSNFVQILGIDPDRERNVTDFGRWLEELSDPKLQVEDPSRPFHASRRRIHEAQSPFSPVPPEAREAYPSVLLGEDRLAADRGLRPGSPVKLFTVQEADSPQHHQITAREFTVAGAFRTPHGVFDGQNVLVHIDELRSIMGFDPYSEPYVDAFNEVSIRLHDYGRADETIAKLNARLKEAGIHGHLYTWEMRNATFLHAVANERFLMGLVLFVILVVAGFLIFSTLSMMVTEKTRDIGVLSAMGATPAGILSIFLICGGFIGLAGCALGIVTGCLSSIHLNDFNNWMKRSFGIELFPEQIYKLREIPYELDPLWVAQVAAIALGMALLFALIPAWRASRMDPVQALRYE